MVDAFIASQILVGIAFLTDFASFQFKDRKKIVLFLCISSVPVSIHYFLLDKNTAGVLVFISVLRYLTSYFSTRKIFMFLLIGLVLLGFLGTYDSYYSIIILVAMILFTVGAFQKDDKLLRPLIMMGTVFMIIYDVIIFSPMAILLESFFLVSNVLGYYRFHIKEKSSDPINFVR